MKGDADMIEENMSSDTTLQSDDGDISENTADNAVVYAKRRKKGGISDTMAMQGIVCLIIAIAFAVFNIVQPDLAADVFSVYSEKTSGSDGVTDMIRAVGDFLCSTPNV